MTRHEMNEFLSGRHLARIATVKRDGAPFVVPVWYDWDGKFCYIVGRKKSNWIQNIRRERRVTVLIDELDPDSPKVIIEGIARIVGSGFHDWIEIGRRMVKKYYGSDAGDSYLEGSKDQPRYTIKITPEKITTWRNPKADDIKANPRLAWHPRYYVPGTKWYKMNECEGKAKRIKESDF
jgi:PPOX class probable F420-dependent enzyme